MRTMGNKTTQIVNKEIIYMDSKMKTKMIEP
jgi:hypothetical protein